NLSTLVLPSKCWRIGLRYPVPRVDNRTITREAGMVWLGGNRPPPMSRLNQSLKQSLLQDRAVNMREMQAASRLLGCLPPLKDGLRQPLRVHQTRERVPWQSNPMNL